MILEVIFRGSEQKTFWNRVSNFKGKWEQLNGMNENKFYTSTKLNRLSRCSVPSKGRQN